MSREETIKFDHFKNVEELLEHIKMWYVEDEAFYARWFGLNDLYKLGQYIESLQSQLDIANKNKEKLKEYINELKIFYETHTITDGVHSVDMSKQLIELMNRLSSIIGGNNEE